MKVFVTGGSGYVGGAVLRHLSLSGHECRVLSRDAEAHRRRLTALEGVYPVRGDITASSPDQLAELMSKCEAVVHLVGVIVEKGTPGYEAIHVEGTRRVLAAAERAKVKRYLHMSALGARPGAPAHYQQTKWAAEELVRGNPIPWTIFRPSIIFGENDEFLNVFAGIARRSPAVPVIGAGRGRLQPIWVEDVARCFAGALTKAETAGQAFELGGERAYSLEELLRMVAGAMGKRRFFPHIPEPVARLQAKLFNLLPVKPPFTEDQITMLAEDNVCDPGPMKRAFGFEPRALEDYLRERFGRG
ncbi:MAG: complex I NDUFA9 subunit family protein [Candidatus Tectomicrobia bacterium]|uniref:Complex I NDUFA9 subunit family protein n=1 Tax=Tectimicrobiota bacterium TaxID=2528274 RepID=A0A932HY34_UNCTE|nr:complex I NDUFA9 subunit family protein [Candidatus Tectomicrobia bacterium]